MQKMVKLFCENGRVFFFGLDRLDSMECFIVSDGELKLYLTLSGRASSFEIYEDVTEFLKELKKEYDGIDIGNYVESAFAILINIMLDNVKNQEEWVLNFINKKKIIDRVKPIVRDLVKLYKEEAENE